MPFMRLVDNPLGDLSIMKILSLLYVKLREFTFNLNVCLVSEKSHGL